MEVHHHAHTPRKKWTHYFWEFVMLFLAVFCGFLAENEREHLVEQRRGKQFMKMMVEDLIQDTVELSRIKQHASDIVRNIDTTLPLIYLEKLTDSNIINIYKNIWQCIAVIRSDLQDRTSTQLKSAGNLRLIKRKNITDSLANYWYLADILQNTNQPIYEADRRVAKDIIFSLFNFDNYTDYFPNRGIKKFRKVELLDEDFATRIKLGNYINSMKNQLSWTNKFVFNWTVMRMRQAADNLIMLIKEEYNI